MEMGDWALPGAAIVFIVIAGMVLVGLDDIVMGAWWRRESTRIGGSDTERMKLLRIAGHTRRAWHHLKHRRPYKGWAALSQRKDDQNNPRSRDRQRRG